MRRWLTTLLLSAGSLLVLWAIVDAQAPTGNQPPPPAGAADFKEERLEAEKPNDRDLREFDRMKNGTYPFDNPNEAALREPGAQTVITNAIKYYIYRLTWSEVQEARESSMSDVMDEILGGPNNNPSSKIFPPSYITKKTDDIAMKQRRDRQWAFLRLAVPHVIKCSQDVLQNKVLAARLNAARILERVAEWGFESVADPLLNVMNNPREHDAVRLWAIQGLGYLLRDYSDKGQLGSDDEKGLRYQQCMRVIYEWLNKASFMPSDVIEQMTTPERAAIVYIRKRAIRSLGMSRRALIVDGGRSGVKDGPVAELLAKIMVNVQGSVIPEASWSERVDAAYAICQMSPKLSPSLNTDVAAYQFAQFLAALGANAVNDPNRSDPAKARQRWKYFAVVLKESIDHLEKEHTGNEPGAEFVRKLIPQMTRVIENLDDPSKFPQAPQDLFNYLSGNSPPNKTLFKPS